MKGSFLFTSIACLLKSPLQRRDKQTFSDYHWILAWHRTIGVVVAAMF